MYSDLSFSPALRPGVVFILLSSAVTGLLFTLLVLLASKAWRHFSRRYVLVQHWHTKISLPKIDMYTTSILTA